MQSSINKDKHKNKIICFFNTRLARFYFYFYFFVEVRAFTVVLLKNLAFSISKGYFICFTTILYDTSNIKCSIFYHFI